MRTIPEPSRTRVMCVSKGLYWGVFDAASPVRRPNLWDELWAEAGRQPGIHLSGHLPEFNALCHQLGHLHQALVFIPMFPGIYSLDLYLYPAEALIDATELSRPGYDRHPPWEIVLDLPTGAICVSELHKMTESAPSLHVAPGQYRALGFWSCAEESRHEWLEQLDAYPPSEGPDFIVHLQQCA